MLDFRNTNTLWASVLVESLVSLGLTTAVISPGSRSTPLTIALAAHTALNTVPILDERSASFWALGHAKASGCATLLVCTSGTAGANYLPAVIEAAESRVPLLLLTADRPPELRDCASGQTIDQQKLFGHYVRYYAELALPEATVPQLRYLRQAIAHAWQQCHFPVAGAVHLNCPFRDPLAPISDGTAIAIAASMEADFFHHLTATPPISQPSVASPIPAPVGQRDRGLIIVGPAMPPQPDIFCRAIATLAQRLGWPVLADGLSPLRNYATLLPTLVTTYDLLLRHDHHAKGLVPDEVIQIGALPTSKVLRQWLAQTDPLRWVMHPDGRNQDPLHGRTVHLSLSLDAFVSALSVRRRGEVGSYGKAWGQRDAIARQRLAIALSDTTLFCESQVSGMLPQLLPAGMPIMIANSMPVRDVEWFWPPNDRGIRPYVNRGANGIDGTLSTALGIARHHGQAVLLTGDLALLHDGNGFLNAAHRQGHLTILLINNRGGGIFEMLPIAQFDPPFETYFATPQAVNFAHLAAAHGVAYSCIKSWEQLKTALSSFPDSGIRLLEIPCDRKRDAQYRQSLLATVGQFTITEPS